MLQKTYTVGIVIPKWIFLSQKERERDAVAENRLTQGSHKQERARNGPYPQGFAWKPYLRSTALQINSLIMVRKPNNYYNLTCLFPLVPNQTYK